MNTFEYPFSKFPALPSPSLLYTHLAAVQVLREKLQKRDTSKEDAMERLRKKKMELKSQQGVLSKGGVKGFKGSAATADVTKLRKTKKSWIEKQLNQFGLSFEKIVLRDPRAIEAVNGLDLSKRQLRKLKLKFDAIDLDGSGAIDADEFFTSVGEQQSPLTDRLFSLIDLDGSGVIEYEEYVRVMATYCMFSKDEILRFCFDTFDTDQSGQLDEKEFIQLCTIVNAGAPAFLNNFKKALEEFDANDDGFISYDEFVNIDIRYPLVLFPAFRLQDTLQRNSLGEKEWLHVIEKYQEKTRIEEYKRNNNGKLPPDPLWKALIKYIFPCLYKQKVHIKLGADLEKRHRGNAAGAK